jgi:hypothetical protein
MFVYGSPESWAMKGDGKWSRATVSRSSSLRLEYLTTYFIIYTFNILINLLENVTLILYGEINVGRSYSSEINVNTCM